MDYRDYICSATGHSKHWKVLQGPNNWGQEEHKGEIANYCMYSLDMALAVLDMLLGHYSADLYCGI